MAARGSKYRKSKYKGCGLCKSHKKGWQHRFKAREAAVRDQPIE